MEKLDVAIVGGGPGGSTTGAFLKKYKPGLAVGIFERESFPRDHVGESQLPLIGKVLAEIDVWDRIEAAWIPTFPKQPRTRFLAPINRDPLSSLIMNLLALSLGFAFSCVPSAPTDRPHVESVSAAVARLRPPAGTTIQVSSSLREARVYLDPHRATSAVALQALATALHASVVEKPGIWTLVVTEADRKTAERTRVADRLAWIRLRVEAVERYQADALKGRTLPVAVASEIERQTRISEAISRRENVAPDPHFATELLPSENLLLALIHKIGEAKIASVPVDSSRVWEDAPVPGALALPEHREAVAIYEGAVAKLRGTLLAPRLKAGIDRFAAEAFFLDWRDEWSPLTRLRIRVQSESTRLLVSLEGYDAGGAQRTAATLIAMPRTVWQPPERLAKAESLSPTADWVPLSDANLATTPLDSVVSVRRTAPTWLTDPEMDEPLDRMAGEPLAALEPEEKRCVAIQASDGLWRTVRPAVMNSRLSVAAFRTMMREEMGYERIESVNGVVWRLRDAPDRYANADRRVLGAFARATLRHGAISLRDLSVFHRSIGPRTTSLTRFWEQTLRGSAQIRTFSGDASHPFYAMLGAIPANVWDARASGIPVTIKRLGIEGQFAAVLDEDRTPVESVRPFPDVLKHLRESFASDTPGAATLSVASRRTPLIGLLPQNVSGEPQVFWTDRVPVPPVEEVVELTKDRYEQWMRRFLVQLGYRDRIAVSVRFPNGLVQAADFVDPLVTTSVLSDYSSLLQEVRDTVWEGAKRNYSPTGNRPSIRSVNLSAPFIVASSP